MTPDKPNYSFLLVSIRDWFQDPARISKPQMPQFPIETAVEQRLQSNVCILGFPTSDRKYCFWSEVGWILRWETQGYEGPTVDIYAPAPQHISIYVHLSSSNPCRSRANCNTSFTVSWLIWSKIYNTKQNTGKVGREILKQKQTSNDACTCLKPTFSICMLLLETT